MDDRPRHLNADDFETASGLGRLVVDIGIGAAMIALLLTAGRLVLAWLTGGWQ